MRLKWGGWKATRTQLVFWGALAGLTGLLLWAARAYPQWPWFSVWVLLLLTGIGVFSVPRVRRALDISWFGVTLLTLTAVSLANVFLYYVESHRQRSERLEVRGVYHDQATSPLTVGVGLPDLDVVLEGDPVRFERWGVDISAAAGDTFVVETARDVESLRVKRGSGWGFPRSGRTESVLGHPLTTRNVLRLASRTDTTDLRLIRGSRRGLIRWGASEANLSLDDALLDRTFGRRLRQGIQLAELPWDSLPELGVGRDSLLTQLVLTETKRGRQLGRFNLTLPRYRVVSRSRPHVDDRTLKVLPGDTLWVRSRGNSWAFSLGRVPAVSRIAAPTAVLFVNRPRPTGWALPSAEACGPVADRCAIISSERLPPPQAHFDLGGFGLDPEQYGFLARLETGPDRVDIVSAHERISFDYGLVQPVSAQSRDADGDAGYLMRVHRSDTSSRSAVLLTILGLYGLLVSALLVLLGNPFLAGRLRAETANTSAAWALLNLFIVFLGVRLVLGLRVAYAAPFYDRAAATSVGLWITFAIMLVLLGRWDAWVPTVWRAARRVGQPARRLLLGSGRSKLAEDVDAPDLSSTPSDPDPLNSVGPSAARRGRSLARLGVVGLVVSLAGLVWQRPAAGFGILVAVIGLGAWTLLGLFGASRAVSQRRRKGLSLRPVDVLTADFLSTRPSRAFTVAAGAAVVLALAIQAPIVALGPVSAGLALFALATLFERSDRFGSSSARAWALYGVTMGALAFALWVFIGLSPVALATWAVGTAAGALLLRRRLGDEKEPGSTALLAGYRTLLEIGRSIFSGVAWTFVLGGLGFLTFLNFQQIPPFVRFALVFLLFLLAVRTGLVCRRVLNDGAPGAHVTALGLLVIPLGVLLVFMLFDFGLGLVFFVPMMVTVLLAAEVDRLPRTLAAASAAVMVLVSLAAWSVLNPSVRGLERSETVTAFSEEFSELGNPFVDALRHAGLSTPITRATVRSVAASNPELIEEALAYGGSSEALLAAAPSLEQVWGGRAYAASGWTGTGLAGTTALGRGVPTVVSYAENAFSVYVLSEHGALGGIAVLLLYLSLLVVVAFWIGRVGRRIHGTPAGLAGLALTVGSVLWLVLPAVYVAASNLGLIPLTGQNMPFLGLNSWADVVLVSGIGTGVFVTLAGLTRRECGEESDASHAPRGSRPRGVFGGVVYSLLGLSALALVVVAVGLVRQADRGDRRQGLEYQTLLAAVDEILGLGEGKEVLRFDRFTVDGFGRTFDMDSLSITDAGLAIPSLHPGGYLSEEVSRYNAFQRERAQIVQDDPTGFEQLEPYNPSLFRPYVRSDGSLGVTRTASAWNRRVPSPFGERWAGDVRTGDADVSWSLYNGEASVPLGQRVRLTRRVEGRRRSCAFEPDGADTHAYCLSEARSPQVTLLGVGTDGGPKRLVSGWRATRLDGERVATGDSAALRSGSVVEIEPLGPAIFGRQQSGLLSTRQWINGRMRRRGEPRPPLDIVAALGRGPIDPDAPPEPAADVELSINEAMTYELTEQLDTFLGGLPIPIDFATVVVARLTDGAVLAMGEVGTRSEPGRSRLLERVVPGSAVKPLLAAAVLSQRPELATLQIPARSGLVRRVGGAPRIPLREAFRTTLNCGFPENGRVNLEGFLRCSNNEYAATLTLAGATLPGSAVDPVRAATTAGWQALEGRRVPRGTLLESALTEGMQTLFDVSTDPTITDSNRRSADVWTGLAFSDGSPARAPFQALPDASRPALLGSPEADGTDLSLLYRYAFGAWENRWNVLDLATAFGRVTTDRRVQLTLALPARLAEPLTTGQPTLGLSEFDWYDNYLAGLAGVARDGTARGLAQRWRRAGVPGTVFAKTGTLAEDEARRGSGLFIKSMLFAVGQTADGARSPLECGMVGSVYLSFKHGGESRSLPSYQVAFAERRLARFLAEHWEEFGACPSDRENSRSISTG